MPLCKECHSRISKFDKDICPICGCKNPLDGIKSETVEITSEVDLSKEEFPDYKPTKRKIVILLFLLVGFTGAPFFYMHYLKKGFQSLVINLLIIATFGSLLAFLTPLGPIGGYLLGLLITYVLNAILAFVTYRNHSLVDGNGELLQ